MKANIHFSYGLKKNEKLLNHELEIVSETLTKELDGYQDYLKKVQELAESVNSNKDIQSAYKQVEFEKLQEAYNSANEELVKEIEEYDSKMGQLNEMEYSGKLHKINFENLPSDLSKKEFKWIESSTIPNSIKLIL